MNQETMNKDTMKRAILEVKAFCRRTKQKVIVGDDGTLFLGKQSEMLDIVTPETLAARLTQGHERRRHEELLASLEASCSIPTKRVQEAMVASEQALAGE